MNNQKGFTLIELIVVIVILGILSAVAVPKFVDMQGEAKKAVLEGIRGSFKSAVMMAHGKCLVSNVIGDSTINVEGSDVEVNLAYPDATTANLSDLVDLDGFTVADDTTVDEFKAELSGTDLVVTYGAYSFTYTPAVDANTDGVADAVPAVSLVSP